MSVDYRLFINSERTRLVILTFFADGSLTVATREETGDTWSLPVYLTEESLASHVPGALMAKDYDCSLAPIRDDEP